MNQVTHFHVPVDDMSRAKHFYREVFGWEIDDIGSAFQIMRTVPSNNKEKPTTSEAVYGALYKRQRAHDAPSIVVEVPSIDETVKKVKAAGGKLITPKGLIGLFGLLAEVTDTEGNIIGLFEKKEVSKNIDVLLNR